MLGVPSVFNLLSKAVEMVQADWNKKEDRRQCAYLEHYRYQPIMQNGLGERAQPYVSYFSYPNSSH